MPPVTRDEHGLAWVLDALYYRGQFVRAFGSLLLLESGENQVEVLNRFIVFTFFGQVVTSHELLGQAWSRRVENPPLAPLNRGVPSTGRQRVGMDFATRPLGSNQEPPVRR